MNPFDLACNHKWFYIPQSLKSSLATTMFLLPNIVHNILAQIFVTMHHIKGIADQQFL